MCAEHRMGEMGLQDDLADLGDQASRGSKGTQGPLASGQASEALKEMRGTLGPPEALVKWATQGPLAPWVPLASQD